MDSFTVKDFIEHNAPCISCKSKVNIFLYSTSKNNNIHHQIKINLNDKFLSTDLKITYEETISFYLNIVSNQYHITNKDFLKNFLQNKDLYVTTMCPNCYTTIHSNYFEFNFDKSFIKPLTIRSESVRKYLVETKCEYVLFSNFSEDLTLLQIYERHPQRKKINEIKLPLIKLDDIKTQEDLVDKIKLYTMLL